MDCHDARHLLDRGVTPGSAHPERAALGFHLARCAACREHHARVVDRQLLSGLLARQLTAPRATPPIRRRSRRVALRTASAALLVGGALAVVPYASVAPAVAAQPARPALSAPAARPPATPRSDAALLQAMLARPVAPASRPAARPAAAGQSEAALLRELLAGQPSPAQARAAQAHDRDLANAELAAGLEIAIPPSADASADQLAAATTYRVQQGDCLWTIAQRFYGNGMYWTTIWRANYDVIGNNPNLIYPNQVFNIPATPDPVSDGPAVGGYYNPPLKNGQYMIVSGDTLSGIALRFYGNGNRWPAIYSANAGVIGGNPDLIYPGTVLTLP